MILDNDLINQINREDYTLIIESKTKIEVRDKQFGVICLLENYESDFGKINVYDKLIGKGAALLLSRYNLKNVYAKTITTQAIEILESKCNLMYQKEVEHILNRDRSDLCPIEKIAKQVSSVDELYTELYDFYTEKGYLNV